MLTINGKSYPVKTGFGSIYLFCEQKGLEFGEFLDRIAKYDFKNIENEMLDDLATLVLCFIKRGGEAGDLSKYDIIDWIGEGNADDVFGLLTESMGKSKNLEAPQEGAKEKDSVLKE